MISKLNLFSDEIIYWDDDEDNVKIAKDLGINAFVFTDIDSFRAKITKFVV